MISVITFKTLIEINKVKFILFEKAVYLQYDEKIKTSKLRNFNFMSQTENLIFKLLNDWMRGPFDLDGNLWNKNGNLKKKKSRYFYI